MSFDLDQHTDHDRCTAATNVVGNQTNEAKIKALLPKRLSGTTWFARADALQSS